MDSDSIRWAIDRCEQMLDPYLGGVNDRLDRIIALLEHQNNELCPADARLYTQAEMDSACESTAASAGEEAYREGRHDGGDWRRDNE